MLRVSVKWIESEELMDDDYESRLRDFDAILVPGGFGKRGIAGMIRAITYARKSRTPYFGICLGMQTACIEFARNVCGLKDADSTEFDSETPYPVIFKLRDLVDVEELGGTMRLGAWPCNLAREFAGAGDLWQLMKSANATVIVMSSIRNFAKRLEKAGLVFSGVSPDGKFVEMVELPRDEHPWFLGCQFHPEYKSKPLSAHPLFSSFVRAAHENRMHNETSMDKNGEAGNLDSRAGNVTSAD